MFKKRSIAAACILGAAALSTQAGTAWLDDGSVSYSDSQQVTVFNPDGSSYSLAPVDIAYIEPMTIAFESPSDEYFAVLEPISDDYYVGLEPSSDMYIVTMSEPVIVISSRDDSSMYPKAQDFSTIEENHRLNVDHL
jgi:hypothetical protein